MASNSGGTQTMHASADSENRTVLYSEKEQESLTRMTLMIFDSEERPTTIHLTESDPERLTFGRESSDSTLPDISVSSKVVSRQHAVFEQTAKGWMIRDMNSRNGLLVNERKVKSAVLHDRDMIRVADAKRAKTEGILILCSADERGGWKAVTLDGRKVTIGRSAGNTIRLNHVSVSGRHASIVSSGDGYEIVDEHSTNGVFVNGKRVNGKLRLGEKDVITITTTRIVYSNGALYYMSMNDGISVEASDVVIVRGRGRRENVTCDHVSLRIEPGELVSIIGGSGAGKSTILNAMCGYLQPRYGHVYINGTDLYENFDALKRLIGYVPQSDIVYDDLSLHDMLLYTAILRLPKDTSDQEYEAAIDRAIGMVELSDKKNSLIRNLSGGQRKRASIAVELLSDPNLLFLDEPASGLDPGTERSLMQTLRKMADQGKTIILVTHSTLQLQMCDKIVFMGRGGRLCCYASLRNAMTFFGIRNIVDVYELLNNHSKEWQNRFLERSVSQARSSDKTNQTKMEKPKSDFHLGVLCARYAKLLTNDRARLILILGQAPLLVCLIALVANGDQFHEMEITQNLLFCLACCGFWVGMLNAIQEICKERTIVRREYMTGMSLTSYILSKFLVLGAACFVQSIMIVMMFIILIGSPDEGLIMHPWLEMWVTTFLLELGSTAMGLLVSALVNNPDRATTLAPILLMPQILFSGLIFELKGITSTLSWAALCRWSMEGYGTTSNLNHLPSKLVLSGMPVAPKESDFFLYTTEHLWKVWGIILLFTLICLIGTRIAMNAIKHSD